MKSILSLLIIALVLTACGPGNRRSNAYDNNPAENGDGDIERNNSETNEEYARRVAMARVSKPVDKNNPGLKEVASDSLRTRSSFATKAAEAGLAEINLAELALKKTTDKKIKDFAEMMLEDHRAVNEELKTLAATKGIELPTECPTCGAAYKELHDLNTKEFNQRYAELMLSDHEQAVKLFSQEAQSGKDPDLKNWAGEKLPALTHHLAMAKDLRPTTNFSASSEDKKDNNDKKQSKKERRKSKKQKASKG